MKHHVPAVLFGSTLLAATIAAATLGEAGFAGKDVTEADGRTASLLRLNAGIVETKTREGSSREIRPDPFEGRRLHLVQFAGPILPRWFDALEATGVRVLAYVPDNGYLVYGDAPSLERLASFAAAGTAVRWHGAFLESHKVLPSGEPSTPSTDAAPSGLRAVQLVLDPEANPITLALIDKNKSGEIRSRFSILAYLNVIVSLPTTFVETLAQRPDVVSIQPYVEPSLEDERQDQILAANLVGGVPSGPGYLGWLLSKGFTQVQFDTTDFVVDLTDSGIDNGTTAPNHFGLYESGLVPGTSRVAYNRLLGTPNLGSTLRGCDGHGTLDAHVVAGFSDRAGFPHADSSGFHSDLGVCPFVRIGSSVIFDPTRYTYPNLPNLQSAAYRDGARISNNSWGSAVPGVYTIDSQAYDALVRDAQPNGSTAPSPGDQQMVVLFSAGNSGPGTVTIGSPGTAKNVITVGAAESVQAFGGADGCGIDDGAADHADDMAPFSSRGPCADGRMKPDLVAPGTHITGGVLQVASPPELGMADPCFTASNLCGGAGADLFFPPGQQWTTASSGTSFAAPAVAGAAALARQFFVNEGREAPSPAMTKALLVSSARYLTGTGAGDSLWSGAQGMGEVNLGTILDGGARVYLDQRPADLFTATGQVRTYSGTVSDPSSPFRVTLAWTDAPGSTVGAAYNNDLDLEVAVGGATYLGNVFAGSESTPGGAADKKNNLESVFLPTGTSGPFTVAVRAANINSDGVPGIVGALDQDFALVIANAEPTPDLDRGEAVVIDEECAPPNGAIDPGERVTVELGLTNRGTADAANVVAELEASEEIIPVTATRGYADLPAGGAVVSRAFAFIANGRCGDLIKVRLSLRDGAGALGKATFVLRLGGGETCCGGTGPKPVPDGRWVAGLPVRVSKSPGGATTAIVTWDVAECAAESYNVYSGPLSAVSTGGYDSFENCGLAPTGTAGVELGEGSVFFLVVSAAGPLEGSHGRDSDAVKRSWSAAGHCSVLSTDGTGVCP